jgi:hypothetical protein
MLRISYRILKISHPLAGGMKGMGMHSEFTPYPLLPHQWRGNTLAWCERVGWGGILFTDKV